MCHVGPTAAWGHAWPAATWGHAWPAATWGRAWAAGARGGTGGWEQISIKSWLRD